MVEEVTQSQKGPMPRRPGEQRWGGGGGPAAALWEAEPAAGPATTGRLSEASGEEEGDPRRHFGRQSQRWGQLRRDDCPRRRFPCGYRWCNPRFSKKTDCLAVVYSGVKPAGVWLTWPVY